MKKIWVYIVIAIIVYGIILAVTDTAPASSSNAYPVPPSATSVPSATPTITPTALIIVTPTPDRTYIPLVQK